MHCITKILIIPGGYITDDDGKQRSREGALGYTEVTLETNVVYPNGTQMMMSLHAKDREGNNLALSFIPIPLFGSPVDWVPPIIKEPRALERKESI